MYHKGFKVLIQYCFSKFFLIDGFYLLGDGQSLGGSIRPVSKFFLGKLDVCIAKHEKKYP